MSAELERGRQITDHMIVGNGAWISFIVRCAQKPLDRIIDGYLSSHPKVKHQGGAFSHDRVIATRQFGICEASAEGCPQDCQVRRLLQLTDDQIAAEANRVIREMRDQTGQQPRLSDSTRSNSLLGKLRGLLGRGS